jgi:hypothetical protein
MLLKVKRLRLITFFAICFILISAAGLMHCLPLQADGGFAFSGSFSNQDFEISQGSSISAPSIYVIVFNNGDEDIQVQMSSETPVGVSILLSEEDFTLQAGGYKEISVSVEATVDAAPGEYEITVIAEPYKYIEGKIQILGSASQTASLQVTGESGTVSIQAVSPDGTPVIANIRLFKQIGTNKYEFAYSDTGLLDAVVSPGSYIAEGYVGGVLRDEQSFDIANGETETITLTVGTIYFEQFDVLEYTNEDTGEFAFAEMVYTVRNVYEEVDTATIMLEVKRDGQLVDQKQIASLSPLVVGRLGQSYQYIPIAGWASADYTFKLVLQIDGETYTSSAEREIDVGDSSGSSASDDNSNLPLIVGIVCAVFLLLDIAFYMIYRSRKKTGGKQHKLQGTEKYKLVEPVKPNHHWILKLKSTGKKKH